ncbi:PLP-dependent aspartate aminotransferase family protein [Anaerolentibacter hominis]|uniref:trans-sulfuration enzyme family protein n=1 Tax=Anaerolentibacter hominis TaxID=3079009 RepID=UPI0031B848DD
MIGFGNYSDFDKKENLHMDSKVVHGALGNDPSTGAVSFPIFQSATFRHVKLGQSTGFDYSRVQNPTRQELERTMAILEEGLEGFAYASGQAAAQAVFSLMNPGDHILLSDDIYGGTYRSGKEYFKRYGVDFEHIDMSDLDIVKSKIRENTKMIFVETPTNPMMHVADIAAIAEIAHSKNILMTVDNTFLSPYFQRPLTLGADIVMHSGTKYIAGHNDTVAGLVVVKTPKLAEHFRFEMKSSGACLAPMDSWLLLRGVKTLALRMERHNENALKVAQWLRTQPKIKEVFYVGFPDHPGYEISCRQASGFGGMISFHVDCPDTVEKILNNLKMILFAESLGGVESLMTYPSTQTHETIPKEIRDAIGVTDTLLRLSVGIEKAEDIIADLDQALNG